MRARYQHQNQSHKSQNSHQLTGKNNLDAVSEMRQRQINPLPKRHPRVNEMLAHDLDEMIRHAPVDDQQSKQDLSVLDQLQVALIMPIALLGSLNRQQVTGLIFMMLVCGAYTVNHAPSKMSHDHGVKQPKQPRIPQDKSALKESVYNQVCGDASKVTFNKPAIALGSRAGILMPNACITGDMDTCASHSKTLQQFSPDYSPLFQLRETIAQQHQSWLSAAYLTASKIQQHHDADQSRLFDEMFATIYELKNHYLASANVRQIKGGNCGEHTSTALTQLLQKKLQYGLDIKIQFVTVLASQSKNTIVDHAYLLLDSDIEDIEINHNSKLVQKTLDGISKGKICDPWNHGYFADLKTDQSGFYKSEAGWDQLSIKTYNLNFSAFNQLSTEAQQFICQELSQMGLYVEPRSACRLFRKKAKVVQPEPGREQAEQSVTHKHPY